MNEKLDLLLVNPSNKQQMYGSLGVSLAAVEPPIWTGLLAAFIRQNGFSVKIIDAEALGWNAEYTADQIITERPLLVGVAAIGANPSASSTPKMFGAGHLLKALKDKHFASRSFLYGIHPSALPAKTLKEEAVDFVCRGESFYTVLKLLKDLKSGSDTHKINGLWYIKDGRVIDSGWGELVKDLDELPFIAWDLLPMERYQAHNWHCFGHLERRKPYAVIYSSLGCPFSCSYCNIAALYDGKPGIRFRSIKKVVEEIDYLVENYKIRNLKIIDELFVLKEDRIMEFCASLIKRAYDLNIWAYARVDTVNKTMLENLKRSGVNWLCYGIESASTKVRDGVSKGRFDKDTINKAMRMTHDAGISIIGNFLFGLPDDSLETMQETYHLARELKCEYVNFYTTMAYPGSRLYEESLRSKVRMPDSWVGYSQFSPETIPLASRYLTPSEILRFRDQAFIDYFSDPAYQEMIKEKFGEDTVEHINGMLKHKIERNLLKTS